MLCLGKRINMAKYLGLHVQVWFCIKCGLVVPGARIGLCWMIHGATALHYPENNFIFQNSKEKNCLFCLPSWTTLNLINVLWPYLIAVATDLFFVSSCLLFIICKDELYIYILINYFVKVRYPWRDERGNKHPST